MSQMDTTAILGERVAWWLRASYHGSRAKNVARDFDVSEATAKRWLGGDAPTSAKLLHMAQRFGWRFWAFVGEPAIGTPAAFAEMHSFEMRIARLEAEKERDDAAGALAFAGLAPGAGNQAGQLARPDEAQAPAVDPDGRRGARP